METPSEWAKRFNQAPAGESVDAAKPQSAAVESPASAAAFPDEPFLCPACGQLLGPSCRICVACKQPINPAEIARTPAAPVVATSAPSTHIKADPVRYPWRILFAVLGVGIILSLISIALLGEQKGPLLIQTVPLFAGIWVFFDAARRRLPRPFRWAMGTVLLLAVVFPWYLARRNKPESAVPFIEAETGRTTRILLIALLVFFLISVIVNIWQNPQPGSKPDSAPKIQPSSGSTSRITSLRPMGGGVPSRLLCQKTGWVIDGSDLRAGHDSLANDHQA
jgi:hypothetical protein